MKLTIGAFFLLSLSCGTLLLAQDVSGTMGGTILDPSGAAIPSARITITNSDRNQVVRTV
jgi:hypothetical protein